MEIQNLRLGWIDYVMLGLFLGLSTLIGVWYGCFGSKQVTTKDFLMGGGKMRMLPTALSLFATLCSASTMLGIPVEIYYYGTMYLYFVFAWLIASFFTAHIFIPKFRELGYISIYTYLEKRFSLALRISVTLTYITSVLCFMAVILYGPSLALSQVTGLNIWLAIVSCGVICTFYTSIGGLKAVICSDVAQSFVILIGVILSIVFGFVESGGIQKVLETAIAGQRMQFFRWTFDPTVRYSIWSVLIGGTFYATACSCVLQTQVQRYMCVKTTREAQIATWINNLMCVLLIFLCGTVGLLIYARYNHCDPLRAKLVSRADQFYPLFVTEIFHRFPGLTGLFIASVMSGSLSSISSGVNSIAAVIIEDIWKPLTPNRPLSDRTQTKVSKYISISLGLFTILFAFFMSYLTNVLVIVYSVMGTLAAPIMGVFILGFFVPRVNSQSALIAYLSSLTFQLWILIGANFTRHLQPKQMLPTSIDGCLTRNLTIVDLNQTSTGSSRTNNFFLPLYSISFMWYAFNGVVLTVIIGLICSLICHTVEKPDSSLLISFRQVLTGCCGTSKKDNTASGNVSVTDRHDTGQENDNGMISEEKELMMFLTSNP